MSNELTIREMGQDEDFAHWFAELLELAEAEGVGYHVDDHYLVASNEIGDWVGGLRYTLRGGVAHLLEVVVRPEERRRGHAHRLLAAFEERAADAGAHLVEFWTNDDRSQGLLAAFGWRVVLRRTDYIGRESWTLMDKPIAAAAAAAE